MPSVCYNLYIFMSISLEGLNERQKEAVLHKNGPLLVLAGAGAGKTRVIAHRVAYLVSEGVEPSRILAITFTNKAAEEMKTRISSLLRLPDSSSPFVSTFHSLGAFILRRSGKPLGIPRDFSILDREDSLALIKGAIQELGMNPKQFQPARIQAIISRYKGELITNEEFELSAGEDFFPSSLSRIWNKYEEQLKAQKALDFDDLVSKTFILLRDDEESRNFYQNFWHYLLIDEYQDTNKSQYELSKMLAQRHRNICVIGDIDQSIYSFRGADFRNIINFERDYPDHKIVVLEKNYRSTQVILEAAARIIEKNKMRKPKRLVAQKEGGAKISLFEAMNEEEEAEFAAHKIRELIKAGESPSEIAVLYRANFQSRAIEEACLRHRIPYKVLGVQFYQRREIKDIFAYLRAALNRDSLIDIKRIINVPPRGVGKVSVLNYFAGKELSGQIKGKFEEFLGLLDRIEEFIKEKGNSVSGAIRFAIRESGYEDFLKKGGDDDRERLENLRELVNIASRYDGLGALEGIEKLLSDAALMSEQDSLLEGGEAVRLMTVHSAKGLEFRNVFVVGLEEGLFPHAGFGEGGADKEEEERRLFYVAVTRAKEKLFLSFCVSRNVFGSRQLNMPSQFISDIPEHLLEIEEYDRREEIIEIE